MLGRFQRLFSGALVSAAVTIACPAALVAQTLPATQSIATTHPTTLAAATLPATAPVAAAPATRPADTPNPAFAERLSYQMAQGLLRSRPITAQSWPATVAMLEGAYRLNPDEPRIMRLLIEALLREGNTTRALEVLSKYRGTDEGRDDQGAQVQSIDLYVAQLEPLSKKIEYLKDVVARAGIAQPVQSHAAVRAAEFLAESMQDEQALQMVDQALRKNPKNLRALRIKYEIVKHGTPSERLAGMLKMLESNPAQPALALAVAQDLADAGLVQPALQWYNIAVGMYYRLGQLPTVDVIADYAAEIFISGDARNAEQFAQRVTQADVNSLNGWLLRLILLKNLGDKDGVGITSRQAQVALTNRLAMLRRTMGDQTATTRPVEPTAEIPPVDVAADLAKIQASKDQDYLNEFATVAQAMAWIKIYFDEKPADAEPWLNALTKILGPQDPTLARLQGWQLIKAGKVADGRAKLQTAAATDPLAAAGLVVTAPADAPATEKANTEGRALLSNNPSGVTGAALLEMLSPRGIRLVPGKVADSLSAELMQFHRDLMRIIEKPQDFYIVRLEPVRSALQVGDPILVRVTIINVSDFDLTVGPDGILHPDLWFDAQLRGASQQVLQSESFDRITKRLVLPAKQSMSQVARLDTAALSGLLLSNPQKSFQLTAIVMTNPVTIQGQVTWGMAGYREPMPNERMLERQGAPILASEQARSRLNNVMMNGSPSEKVQGIEVLATYFQLLSNADDAKAKEMAAVFGEGVRRAATDSDAGVRAWALYVLSLLTGDQDRPTVVQTMAKDPDWHARLLSCITVALTGQSKDLIKPLEKDADPIVAKLASAVGQMKLEPRQAPPGAGPGSAPPATQPAGATSPAVQSPPAPAGSTPTGAAPPTGLAPTGATPAGATTTPPPPQGGFSLPSAAPGGETPTISTSAPPTTSPSVP